MYFTMPCRALKHIGISHYTHDIPCTPRYSRGQQRRGTHVLLIICGKFETYLALLSVRLLVVVELGLWATPYIPEGGHTYTLLFSLR